MKDREFFIYDNKNKECLPIMVDDKGCEYVILSDKNTPLSELDSNRYELEEWV